MRLTGTLLETELYSGEFKGDDGKLVEYSGERLHVLEGREVTKVKVPKGLIPSGYEDGSAVDLRVTVAAQTGGRGPYLTTTLVSDFADRAPLKLAASS